MGPSAGKRVCVGRRSPPHCPAHVVCVAQQPLQDCVIPICTYETAIKGCWRKVYSFLEHFEYFPNIFPTDVLYDKFIPILFRHLTQVCGRAGGGGGRGTEGVVGVCAGATQGA